MNQQGVKIDHEIRPTLEGIRDGRDEMLEAALRLIEEKTGINTMTAEDPMKVVAIGTGQFVEFMGGRKDF